VISQGRRIISCDSKIADSTGRILAHGTSTLMVLDRPA
jgi:acyl-coenzyme A thioesterase PaaI-like protein